MGLENPGLSSGIPGLYQLDVGTWYPISNQQQKHLQTLPNFPGHGSGGKNWELFYFEKKFRLMWGKGIHTGNSTGYERIENTLFYWKKLDYKPLGTDLS